MTKTSNIQHLKFRCSSALIRSYICYHLTRTMTTCTIILELHIISGNAIDESSVLTYKQWRSAIDYLVGTTGVRPFISFVIPSKYLLIYIQWRDAAWGYHLESSVHVTLLIGFRVDVDAQNFLSRNYSTFLGFLQPVLASPPPQPAITAHRSLMNKRKVTTITKISFPHLEGDGGGYTIQIQSVS